MEERSATYIGTFVDCPELGALRVLSNRAITVDANGFIQSIDSYDQSKHNPPSSLIKRNVVHIPQGSFCLPTFCDLHLHAPQFLYQGTGLHLPLMQWLEEYAFKAEERIDNDAALASRVYTRLAERLKENGTGAVLLFGTIKSETNLLLAKIMQHANIRAFVGKLSMDISPRQTYTEHNATSGLNAASSFIKSMRDAFAHLPPPLRIVEPVITPRFIPSCSDDLLKGLGKLAEEFDVRVQSHLSEARDEVDWVRRERGVGDVEVFERSKLLTHHCIQAHCTYLTDAELQHLARSGTSIAHCPLSNAYFSARPFPLREALDVHSLNAFVSESTSITANLEPYRLKVGLGTDIAGGYSVDIMNAMRSAVMVGRMREGQRIEDTVATAAQNLDQPSMESTKVIKNIAIDWKESLHLATRGGALALGLPKGAGSFVVGAPFDAQLIDVFDPIARRGVGALDFIDAEVCKEDLDGGVFCIDELVVEKWWCVGDTRNRRGMWIQGKKC